MKKIKRKNSIQKRIRKRIRKVGNSFVVTIPIHLIKKMHLSENDIFIVYQESENKITIERLD
ncbi:AbrB/MazE/SpoVT family DNA-binding domain-containing protein [Arcobacter sp.]|uniref:AbrB/MazE/SpoVT family DNA-binding domain-containing protein n=1 Tax=Arcobacter sp. TaxID=1872629 RepID=UPI003D11D9A4